MASKRRLRRKRCEAKRAYADRDTAFLAAQHTSPDVGAYHCPHCGRWHVGHAVGLYGKTHRFKGRLGRT